MHPTPSPSSSSRSPSPSRSSQPTPSLGITLKLHPRHLEDRFWQSPTAYRAARHTDTWATLLLLASAAFHLMWLTRSPHLFVIMRTVRTFLLLACYGHHLTRRCSCHGDYLRRRRRFLLFNRLLQIVVGGASSLFTRRLVTKGQAPAIFSQATRLQTRLISVPRPLEICRAILNISGTTSLLLHAPLAQQPLPDQTASLALCVGLLLYLHRPVAAFLLDLLLPKHELVLLCSKMESVTHLLMLMVSGYDSSPSQHCQQHAAELLVVFVQVFMGGLVPVYVCYKVERRQKLAFLANLALEEAAGGGSGSGSSRSQRTARGEEEQGLAAVGRGVLLVAMDEALLLFTMAVLVWLFALDVHRWWPALEFTPSG